MSGTALSDFADFVLATGATEVSPADRIVNDAQKYRRYWMSEMMRGDIKKMLRGGSSVRETIIFKGNGTFENYQPGQSHEWTNAQRLHKAEAYFRYSMTHMTWVEQEILQNDLIVNGTDDARYHQFADIATEKEMIAATAQWDGMEDRVWATPKKSTMEGTGDGFIDQYSFAAFINEDTNGLWGSTGSWAAGEAWTQVEGIDPTAASVDGRWTPKQRTYSSPDANNSGNVVSTFDKIFEDLQWTQPPTLKEYFENDNLRQMKITTQHTGRAHFMFLLRGGQDYYIAGQQDPSYPDPLFHGIPVTASTALDTAILYRPDAGATPVAYNAATANPQGARYYWANLQYIFPFFHTEKYFLKEKPTKHHNVPDTWVCPRTTWWNLMCTSRQRQGIVSPSTDAAGAGSI